jgi:two-component system NtrC family sensor kinase
VVADPGQLHQVLVNLTVNSMQAMPNGGILTISTYGKNDRVGLRVEDTGDGMSRDVVEKIFVPFFTTKDVDQGTGLGLSVVEGIVTTHGGTINVDSSPGKGTLFEVSLPIDGTMGKE